MWSSLSEGTKNIFANYLQQQVPLMTSIQLQKLLFGLQQMGFAYGDIDFSIIVDAVTKHMDITDTELLIRYVEV